MLFIGFLWNSCLPDGHFDSYWGIKMAPSLQAPFCFGEVFEEDEFSETLNFHVDLVCVCIGNLGLGFQI